MFKDNLSILLLFFVCLSFSVSGSIDGPSSEDTPIRLSRTQHQPITTSHRWDLHESPEKLKDDAQHMSPKRDVPSQDHNMQTQPPSTLTAKLEILEPPEKSFIAGKHFLVKLRVNVPPIDEERFKKAYQHDGHACLSLDEGPYHCWNIENAGMFYADVTDGDHTLVAKLYRNSELQADTTSEPITFTMVHNPEFEGESNHTQHLRYQTKSFEENENNKGSGGGVEVTYPVVHILNPADQVSYSGNDIGLKTRLNPVNPNLFEKYFQNGYTCFNIDFATAYACYSIFNYNTDPLILGLDIGMHTIETSLVNPETGDLLQNSTSGRQTFFMAGKSNLGADLVVDINIRGKLHKVPFLKGGSILEQSKHLCASVGNGSSVDCIKPIKQHLTNAAHERNFPIQD